MESWKNPIDYWDYNKKAILRTTQRLHKLEETDRKTACEEIRNKVRDYTDQLTDEQFLQMMVTMVDDLYKSVNDEVLLATALFEYLDAFGRTLTQVLRERGYVIQYIVENQFFDIDILLRGPFDVFASFFQAAGFVYICPQQVIPFLMQHDNIPATEYEKSVDKYINEARHISDKLVTECHENNLHYIFLEVDFQEGSLDVAMEKSGSPGVLNIFRNEAPVAGSQIAISFPEQKLGA